MSRMPRVTRTVAPFRRRSALGSCISVLFLAAFTHPAGSVPIFEAPFLGHPSGATQVGWDLAQGDVDGDGHADLVASSEYANGVFVSLGRGDGTFQYVRQIPATYPHGVALGRIDADARLDLVIAEDAGVQVLRGGEGGVFGQATLIPYDVRVHFVRLHDVNRDGKLDLLTSSGTPAAAISVRLALGGGVFASTRTDYAAPGAGDDFVVASLNGDDFPDLAVLTTSPPRLAVFPGLPGGAFGARTDYALSGQPSGIVAAELTGDAHLDLAVANMTDTVRVFPGIGTGAFGQPTFLKQPDDCWSLATGDFDRDGRSDLAVFVSGNYPSRGGHGVRIHAGTAIGLAPATTTWLAGSTVRHPVVADFDDDRRLDLACLSYGTTLAILLGNGDGTFGSPRRSSKLGGRPAALALGDLNADGHLDAVTANQANDTYTVLLGNGTGAFLARPEHPTGSYPSGIALADLDGNSTLDVVFSNFNSNTVSYRFGDGTGAFGGGADLSTRDLPSQVAVGDLNHDGRPDLVVSCQSWGVSCFLGTGAGAFGSRTDFVGPADSYSVTIADVNHDTHPDLVAATTFTYTGWIATWLGRGDGTFDAYLSRSTTARPRDVAVADIDGDGHPDALAAGDGGLVVFRGHGDGTFDPGLALGSAPNYGTRVTLSDFDRDGRPDVVTSLGESDAIALTFGTSGGVPLAVRIHGATNSSGAVQAGLVDGDSAPDLVCTSYTDSALVVLRNRAFGYVDAPRAPGVAPTGLQLLPNPATHASGVRWSGLRHPSGTVRVFDLSGRLVRALRTAEEHWDLLDAAGHPVRPGLYLVEARSGSQVARGRLAVLR